MAVSDKSEKTTQTLSKVDERSTTQRTGTSVTQTLKKMKLKLSKVVGCFHPTVLPSMSKDGDDVPAAHEMVPVAIEGGGHTPEEEFYDALGPATMGGGDSPGEDHNDTPASKPKGGGDSPGKEVDDMPAPAPKGGGHSPGEDPDGTPASEPKGGGASPEEPDPSPQARALRMDVASCYVPKHDEDAHFALPVAGVVGVADGVGGYRKKGVDSGAFARALMQNASAGLKLEANKPVCPYTLLRRAHDAMVQSRTPGASTAVILALDGTTLKWAYIGDSGFAVLRGGKIIHRSQPQQHYSNCPYQLRAKGGDCVYKAVVDDMTVRDGDVLVVGTDGLFDNVFDVELERAVRKGTKLGWSPKEVANMIAGTARTIARKTDDITVVVAFIVTSDL